MITAIVVLLCGGAGAVARLVVDGLVQSRRSGEWPLGTLVVNLGGCLVLGFLAGLHPAHRLMLVLGTATVGSYTTFSTWMLETHRPAEDGDRAMARANLLVTLALGLASVLIGRALAGLF